MRRSHRTVHRVIWAAMVVVVGLGVALALVLRPPPEEAPPAAQESHQ